MFRAESYCASELRGPAKDRGQAIMLNRYQWNGILNHLHRGEDVQMISEQERQYREYLKYESREMTKRWENSNESIRNKKHEERVKRDQEKVLEGERRYKELMANDEKKRMEHLNKAQDLVRRLKIGPRQLESATILSEVLKCREIQRNINAEVRDQLKERHLTEGKEIVEQAHQWIEDQSKHMYEKKQRTDLYKKELFNFSKETEQNRQDKANRRAEFERSQREIADRELREQIEREKATLQRKKDAMRKNALEAMRMAEQRRLRDKQENDVDNQIIAVYANGKAKINDLKRSKDKERADDNYQRKNEMAEKIYQPLESLIKIEHAIENEQREKASEELKQKALQKDQERQEFDKRMKAARIQQHLDDIEREKRLKAECFEEVRWGIANRLKNDEVNFEYDQEKRRYRTNVALENRKVLQQQIDEKIRKNNEKNDLEMKFVKEENLEDDKTFFSYANELLENAKTKSRPTLPIQKVIDFYKKHNRLESPRGDPPHLISNVPILKVCKSCEPIKYNADQLKSMNPYTRGKREIQSWR